MKNYSVTFISQGSVDIEVEAESREEAIDKAYALIDEYGDPDWQYDWIEEL